MGETSHVHNERHAVLVTAGMITGLGLLIGGVAEDGRVDRTDLRSVGALLVVLGTVFLLARWLDRREPRAVSVPLDYEAVYKHGWQDCDTTHATGQLAVVLRLVTPDTAVAEIEIEQVAASRAE